MDLDKLSTAGLSRAKASYIKDVAHKSIDGTVPSLEECHRLTDAELVERLTSIKAIFTAIPRAPRRLNGNHHARWGSPPAGQAGPRFRVNCARPHFSLSAPWVLWLACEMHLLSCKLSARWLLRFPRKKLMRTHA